MINTPPDGWRPDASGCPTNTRNLPVAAPNPWPVLASVAQALLPVLHAWDASALDTGNGFTGRVLRKTVT